MPERPAGPRLSIVRVLRPAVALTEHQSRPSRRESGAPHGEFPPLAAIPFLSFALASRRASERPLCRAKRQLADQRAPRRSRVLRASRRAMTARMLFHPEWMRVSRTSQAVSERPYSHPTLTLFAVICVRWTLVDVSGYSLRIPPVYPHAGCRLRGFGWRVCVHRVVAQSCLGEPVGE